MQYKIVTGDVFLKCINCNKETKRNNKYCSNICQKEFEYKEYIKKWKNKEVDGLRGEYQISMHIKTYLFKKFNNQCAKCGWSEINPYTNKIPLEVEHIDGDYKNNNENNLILLCPNCHSLTSTYNGANLNKGRKSRKKYSNQG